MIECENIAFDDLLDAEDDVETHNPEITRHLEVCTRCQTRLAGFAADAEQWDQTRYWLSMGEANDPIYAESLEARDRWNRPVAWNESMAKSLLSAARHPEMLGRIGRYDVERLIGSGGMGVVFKAHDTELNRPVAVKLLTPYLASSGAARNRFAREARAAAAVVDDHVVPIHNVETDDELPFLVMKYIAGGSLQQRLDREGPLEVCEVLRIGMQTAKGLAAAHSQGLIHRDVKPSNILLDEGVDRALLTDFGLARATDDASLTRSGFHPGTPHYMSPEQVRGEVIDGRSDLFGLGCVLYALCTGHPPFRSETSYAVLRRITDDMPRPIRELNSNIPEWLDQVVMRLLAKSPNERFESAEDVAELLEDCLAHVQQPSTTPLPAAIAKFVNRNGVLGKSKPATIAGGFRFPPIGKLIVAAAFAFMLIFAGILIVLELNKGTLTIMSEADDVPILIMKGETIVEKLTVSREGKSTRIAAGKYTVKIEQPFDKAVVANNVVTISGRGAEIVKVTYRDNHQVTTVIYKVDELLDDVSTVQVETQLNSLIDLIQSTIEPDSWKNDQFSISPYPDNRSLVVQQTAAAHTAICTLLDKLSDIQMRANEQTDIKDPKRSPVPLGNWVRERLDGLHDYLPRDIQILQRANWRIPSIEEPATEEVTVADKSTRMLSVRLHGDRKLSIADPNALDQSPQPFTSDGYLLQFSLDQPDSEACYHVVNDQLDSMRAVIRLECSEYMPGEFWQRIGDQSIDLSISYSDFVSVRSGNRADQVVYLPDASSRQNNIQTQTYSGIGRPLDLVKDVRKYLGHPIVSIRLDPPISADQVAQSHGKIGPAFSFKAPSSSYFDFCSDEELLNAIQGTWLVDRHVSSVAVPQTRLNGKPMRLRIDGSQFQTEIVDDNKEVQQEIACELKLLVSGVPRRFELVRVDGEHSINGILHLSLDGKLSLCIGSEEDDPPRRFTGEAPYALIESHRGADVAPSH